MAFTRNFLSALALLSLVGCASTPRLDWQDPPRAFHDTRLQYALLAGEEEFLQKEFGMHLSPSWVERVSAGVALPFSAAAEAVFYPFAASINAFAPIPEYPRLAQ